MHAVHYGHVQSRALQVHLIHIDKCMRVEKIPCIYEHSVRFGWMCAEFTCFCRLFVRLTCGPTLTMLTSDYLMRYYGSIFCGEKNEPMSVIIRCPGAEIRLCETTVHTGFLANICAMRCSHACFFVCPFRSSAHFFFLERCRHEQALCLMPCQSDASDRKKNKRGKRTFLRNLHFFDKNLVSYKGLTYF